MIRVHTFKIIKLHTFRIIYYLLAFTYYWRNLTLFNAELQFIKTFIEFLFPF